MNVAYKHLEAKLRVGEFTIGQWCAVLAGVGLAIGWGVYLSPFGAYVSLISAVYLGAIPAIGALLASSAEFDLLLLARSAVGWKRRSGRYLAGAGDSARGYVLRPGPGDVRGAAPSTDELDLEALWES